jgi:hypothetical protein
MRRGFTTVCSAMRSRAGTIREHWAELSERHKRCIGSHSNQSESPRAALTDNVIHSGVSDAACHWFDPICELFENIYFYVQICNVVSDHRILIDIGRWEFRSPIGTRALLVVNETPPHKKET